MKLKALMGAGDFIIGCTLPFAAAGIVLNQPLGFVVAAVAGAVVFQALSGIAHLCADRIGSFLRDQHAVRPQAVGGRVRESEGGAAVDRIDRDVGRDTEDDRRR